MPALPYLVSGTVKFSGTEQVVEGADISLVHANGTITGTTDSDGKYIINLAELSSWTSGDSITVTARAGNRSKTETTTISGGGKWVNLVVDITSYPDYSLETKQGVNYNALDLMDVDKAYTYNADKTISKVIENYGKFTITRYFSYNSTKQVINENRIVE
jgi:hypothetical protein